MCKATNVEFGLHIEKKNEFLLFHSCFIFYDRSRQRYFDVSFFSSFLFFIISMVDEDS